MYNKSYIYLKAQIWYIPSIFETEPNLPDAYKKTVYLFIYLFIYLFFTFTAKIVKSKIHCKMQKYACRFVGKEFVENREEIVIKSHIDKK